MTTQSNSNNNDNSNQIGSGKCPVKHDGSAPSSSSSSSSLSSLWSVVTLGNSKVKSENQIDTNNSQQQQQQPPSLEEAAKYAQSPHPDQRLPLSTHRAVSSIPRGQSDKVPHHQPNNNNNNNSNKQTGEVSQPQKWVYPSEQQVFNAMKRKGWQGVDETTIPSFLQIHNSVNEKSWNELLKWEDPSSNVKLVKFEGRPNTLTPKAWIASTLFFQDKPFDRHDWYIDNGIDTEKRYVLDFYMQHDVATDMPKVTVDVRPALDTPQAFQAHMTRFLQDAFPGITKAIQDYKNRASSNNNNNTRSRGPNLNPHYAKSSSTTSNSNKP